MATAASSSSSESDYDPSKMQLKEIFDHNGSDKGRNGYARDYDPIFKHLRHKKLRILEIGIGTVIPHAPSSMHGIGIANYKPGASLRAWRDFFPNAEIVGLDIQDDCMFTEDRIQTFKFDSTSSVDVLEFMKTQNGEGFDIIIDDGNHQDKWQMRTFENLYPYLKPGGYFITEDLCGAHRFPRAEGFLDRVEKIMGKYDYFTENHTQNVVVFSKARDYSQAK